jgi:hypothetical protein
MGCLTVRDGAIRVDATATQFSTVYVVGHFNTLLDNASPDVTLRVQGGSPVGDGDAVLAAADASANRGSILLESLDGGAHQGYFKVAGAFTNAAGGRIEVQLPPGATGQGSIAAGWLEDDGGSAVDTTGLPVRPDLAAYLAHIANGDSCDPNSPDGLWADDPMAPTWLQMAQTPGVNDGVVAVNGVSGPGGAPPDGPGGLVGVLRNFGDLLVNSAMAPVRTGSGIIDDLTGGAWTQLAVPVAVAAWQDARPYVEQYALPAVGAAGQWIQQHVQPVVQHVAAPLIAAGVQRITAIPQGIMEIGSLVHDAGASVLAANSRWWAPVLGTAEYRPELWSAFAHGYRQAQAEGKGLEYAVNAELNAATLGLYGDAQSFGPAWQQSQQTGDPAPLAAWLGGTAVDVAMNPLAHEALGAAAAIAAGE